MLEFVTQFRLLLLHPICIPLSYARKKSLFLERLPSAIRISVESCPAQRMEDLYAAAYRSDALDMLRHQLVKTPSANCGFSTSSPPRGSAKHSNPHRLDAEEDETETDSQPANASGTR